MTSKRLVSLIAGLCLAGSTGAWAQQPGNGIDNPDWKEEQAPPPPAFSRDNVVPIEMPKYVSLKIGVDPNTIVVGKDGVVRYVVVMVNTSGSVNAVYEGIRCSSGEVKTYARWSASGAWNVASDPQWKGLNDNMPSRHAQAFARQGACENRTSTSTPEILRALKLPLKARITSPVQ